MIMYHYTLRRYLPSILERGLLISKSRKGRKAVWLVKSQMGAWACSHVLKKRMGGVDEIICIAVDVPRASVKCGHPGLFYVEHDISPERFRGVHGFAVEVIVPA